MPAPYVPVPHIAARVTDAHKAAVWAALANGARLDLSQLVARTGLPDAIVCEVWAMGYAAGRLRWVDEGVGFRGIERVEVAG